MILNRRRFIQLGTAAAAAPIFSNGPANANASPLPPAGADGWVSLLNGRDLEGWYTMLEKSGKGVAEKRNMVCIEEGMLHIMGNQHDAVPAEPGYLATYQEFENVHIRAEYKWGVKRFDPRSYSKRDNGLLYGLVGEDKVWPTCVECQIEEGDTGDYFLVGTKGEQDEHIAGLSAVGLTARGFSGPATRMLPVPASTGPYDVTNFRKLKDGDFESLESWNTVEVIWQGDRSAHIVNGRAVNAASKLQQPDPKAPGKFMPLTRGKLAIEIEFAEIWFRRIEIKSLG